MILSLRIFLKYVENWLSKLIDNHRNVEKLRPFSNPRHSIIRDVLKKFKNY